MITDRLNQKYRTVITIDNDKDIFKVIIRRNLWIFCIRKTAIWTCVWTDVDNWILEEVEKQQGGDETYIWDVI